jgi:hypothetical protein
MKIAMFGSTVIIFCLSFTCRPSNVGQQGSDNYEVVKIDSINNYYFVYSKKNDSIFKIVSHKPLIKVKKCNRVKMGSNYPFLLHSILDDLPAGFEALSPKRNPQINCVGFDDSTSICVEEGMVRDLFSADNLQGLCFIGK